MAVFAVCLLVTVLAWWAASAVNRNSERELLVQQGGQAAAVLTSSIDAVEASLGNAAVVADAVQGDVTVLSTLGQQMLENRDFAVVAVLDAKGNKIASVGGDMAPGWSALALSAQPGAVSPTLSVVPDRRVVYVTTAGTGNYIVYAEAPLPPNSTGVGRSDGPFSSLDYAIYLGEGERETDLLVASVDTVPIGEPRTVETIAFGDDTLVFVASAATSMTGGVTQAAPWGALVAGGILSLVAAAVANALSRGRHRAERFADDIAELYENQQLQTDTLRNSLLPRRLVEPKDLSIEAGYWPAEKDNEIGGDFYDSFAVDDDRWVIVIGDVCGKGVEAAALTGLTRHTVRAAARHLSDPAEVLRWTHEAIANYDADTYVTACVGILHLNEPNGPGSIRLDLARGGHPAPALCRDDTVTLLGTPGTLLGMVEPQIQTTHHDLQAGDSLVFYTDGITDDPGNPLDDDALIDMLEATFSSGRRRDLATAIRENVEQRRNVAQHDDIALLIAHIPADRDVADGEVEEMTAAT